MNREALALLHLADRPTWYERAACRGSDPDLFFPGRGDHAYLVEALSYCAGCPVRTECLDANIDEPEGIWGGTTARERRNLRKLRKLRKLRPDQPRDAIEHGTHKGAKQHWHRKEKRAAERVLKEMGAL